MLDDILIDRNGYIDGNPSLVLFSSFNMPPFRSVKLRSKRQDCVACSGCGTLSTIDYIQFCGGPPVNWVQLGQTPGLAGQRILPQVGTWIHHLQWSCSLCTQDMHIHMKTETLRVIDVRPAIEFSICHLPGSISKTHTM